MIKAKQTTKTRARNTEDKEAKRQQILLACLDLYQTQSIQQISMDKIAKKADLAKGTLYLYFQTKEEVFLYLLTSQFQNWLKFVKQNFSKITQPISASDFAGALTASLNHSPTLPRLLSILHLVLEENLSAPTIKSFKLEMKALLVELSEIIAFKTPALNSNNSLSFLLRLHSVVVGLYQTSLPDPRFNKLLSEVLSDPELEIFKLDFSKELTTTVTLILQGIEGNETAAEKPFHLYKNY